MTNGHRRLCHLGGHDRRLTYRHPLPPHSVCTPFASSQKYPIDMSHLGHAAAPCGPYREG